MEELVETCVEVSDDVPAETDSLVEEGTAAAAELADIDAVVVVAVEVPVKPGSGELVSAVTSCTLVLVAGTPVRLLGAC